MNTKPLNYTKQKTLDALQEYPLKPDYIVSAYAILQCKPESGRTFLNFDKINGNVLLDDYNFINSYEVPPTHKERGVCQLLEDIFEAFNMDKPDDFKGHSLSVSDIVALRTKNGISFHFTDSIGFVELAEETVALKPEETT